MGKRDSRPVGGPGRVALGCVRGKQFVGHPTLRRNQKYLPWFSNLGTHIRNLLPVRGPARQSCTIWRISQLNLIAPIYSTGPKGVIERVDVGDLLPITRERHRISTDSSQIRHELI